MPTLAGKEVGPTGYGTMRTFFLASMDERTEMLAILMLKFRNDLDPETSPRGGIL